jgi:protein-S-isoprenylcysteine O-methyltransferase Ste14
MAFGFVHSLFVADTVKKIFGTAFGETFTKAFYRLLFTLFGILTTLAAIYLLTLIPDVPIYSGPAWFRWLMHSVQACGAIFGMMAFRVIDLREFTGVSQAWRYITKREIAGDIEGLAEGALITTGVYGIVRNPLYLAGIIVFTFNPNITRT